MEITFLGQAGFLIKSQDKNILIDPYLSNSVEKVEPNSYRRQPIDQSIFDIKVDMIICTHNHLDHYDEETLNHFINSESGITFLSPRSVWVNARKYGGNNNFINFNVGSIWSECGLEIKAVKAEHSDELAIGLIISDGERNYYFTGDTLYNEQVVKSVKDYKIFAMFCVCNGKGNNMNKTDAVKFYNRLNAKYFVPIHTKMFDDISVEDIAIKNMVIPQIYQKVQFN